MTFLHVNDIFTCLCSIPPLAGFAILGWKSLPLGFEGAAPQGGDCII